MFSLCGGFPCSLRGLWSQVLSKGYTIPGHSPSTPFPEGTRVPPRPGLGYLLGGTPRAVSRRRIFFFRTFCCSLGATKLFLERGKRQQSSKQQKQETTNQTALCHCIQSVNSGQQYSKCSYGGLSLVSYFSTYHLLYHLVKILRERLIFPFSKFTMKNFNSLILKLSCKDKFSNMKECAEQCYYSDKDGIKCVAFLKFSNTEECKICNPATISEIRNSNNTQIIDYPVDLVYILKYNKKKPVMYLPLDGDNITGASVIGDGVTGTLFNYENTKIQAGKVNQGLHVKNGGRLVLDNTANTCIGNLALCTDGLSIALWINPSMHGSFGHITHSIYSISVVSVESGVIGVWTSGQLNSISAFVTQSTTPVGTWTHVAVVFDPDVGMFYLHETAHTGCVQIHRRGCSTQKVRTVLMTMCLVVSRDGLYPFDGVLDEIKVFYESLTSVGKSKICIFN